MKKLKKLVLKKETISSLGKDEMKEAKGGICIGWGSFFQSGYNKCQYGCCETTYCCQ